MKIRKPRRNMPLILRGAYVLAGLSLIWSGYAITDLMHSGPFGLSVAVAGDIGWITVLWAEHRRITIAGHAWVAPVAGWLIAVGVGVLLALHGADKDDVAQAIAGPFVVLVGKLVWTFALASLRDPAALTPEQEAEIHDVMRDSEYAARLHQAQLQQMDRAADAEIARIRTQARITLARDDADFEVTLERIGKRAEIERRTPLAIGPITAPTANTEHEQAPIAQPIADRPAPPAASANPDREPPSIADLVREQVAITTTNNAAVAGVLAIRPDANRDSVSAAVRRERRRSQMKDGYA